MSRCQIVLAFLTPDRCLNHNRLLMIGMLRTAVSPDQVLEHPRAANQIDVSGYRPALLLNREAPT
jgi:hypothetical protein